MIKNTNTMALNTKSLWAKIKKSENYQKWAKKHDAFEQIAIVKGWTDFEEYDVSEDCKDACEVICLYCYIHFVLDLEFLSEVWTMARDVKYEDFFKTDVKNAQHLIKMIYE